MSNYFVLTRLDRYELKRFKDALRLFRKRNAYVIVRTRDNVELVRRHHAARGDNQDNG